MASSKLLGLLRSMDTDLMNDETLTERKRIVSPSISGSESGSVVVNNKGPARLEIRQDEPLNQEIRNGQEIDSDESEDENEDDFNDYIIEAPLPPPKELHPDKLYALFEFSGDDPSHCELQRDESVTLLNDQDGYWWLVRKDNNGKIGFAPAECLETHEERLARLNCWKNEELEKTSKNSLKDSTIELNVSKLTLRSNKSVTFSTEVDVVHDEDVTDNENVESILHKGEEEEEEEDGDDDMYQYETPYVGAEDEIVSDTFPIVTPLKLAKKNRDPLSTKSCSTIPFPESDTEDTSPLVAPNASFFSQGNYSESIGSYSPSSSEYDSPENTPALNQGLQKRSLAIPIEQIKANIPQSTATINIASSIKMLDDLMDDELNNKTGDDDLSFETEKEADSNDDITLNYYNNDLNDSSKLSSPIELPNERILKKSILSNITDSTFVNSNSSLQLSQSTTMDESEMIHDYSLSLKDEKSESLHPDIDRIYEDSFSRFDELAAKLERLSELMK